MDEIELRFEALQRHLAARRTSNRVEAERLHDEGNDLSRRADVAVRSEEPIGGEGHDHGRHRHRQRSTG